MARWSALTDVLTDANDSCHFSWDELSSIVGELPPSASRHRAWWSGERSHVRAWRIAGFRVSELSLGRHVTFVREATKASSAAPAQPVDCSPAPDPRVGLANTSSSADIVLISCSKGKGAHPAAAQDLYTSPLFRRGRGYAESSGRRWFILSAEHGLVAPHEWLAPYERYLPDTPRPFREAWGQWVVARLDLLVEDLADRTVEIHAGAAYLDPILDRLTSTVADVSLPLQGLTVGQRLQWYSAVEHAGNIVGPVAGALRDVTSADATPESFEELLRDEHSTMTPAAFLDRGSSALKVPGLYSWWADKQAAADLSAGLGHTVEPGMIYAGLAGATRWPSGKRSTNTLWSRIAGMHLGKRHEFSTFRRTLGAIHAHRTGSTAVDELALTQWMRDHLRVIAAPYWDGDTLGRLESDVLRLLDPPLNLQGMEPTPLRRRISELRRLVT